MGKSSEWEAELLSFEFKLQEDLLGVKNQCEPLLSVNVGKLKKLAEG